MRLAVLVLFSVAFIIRAECKFCIIVGEDSLQIKLNETEDGITLDLTLDDLKLSGLIGKGRSIKSSLCQDGSYVVDENDFKLTVSAVPNGFNISWLSNNLDTQFQDCFDLNSDNVNWFGGPERFHAEWPIENLKMSNQPYRTSQIENGAVAERYWLNSKGGYIFVDDKVPLFVDQNNLKNDTICFSAQAKEPFVGRSRVLLQYVVIAKPDPKQAQLHAVENFLGKPKGHPNERIIRYPIWTTWAKYKREINDAIVLEFAEDIANHNFTGQLEIDDFWETCYGSLIFNSNFSEINSTVKSLKDLGFTVSLWTHPFVDDDCTEATQFGRDNNLFIESTDGSDMTTWWNSNLSHHIDFTNPEGQEWFTSRLKTIQEKHGIDSFKFDAGESDWPPQVPVLKGDIETAPNRLTQSYVETCSIFGDLIEIRSGWRTQHLPALVRMIDKDSRWGLDNGLHNLITTLLQMNLNGYTLVLPDMIGGNGYNNDVVTPELLVRWTQANAFMPAMQFSYLPWEFPSDQFNTLEIVRKFVSLHEEYTDEILDAINSCIDQGTPVNPPVWWVDPENEDALKVNDEYMLGESILVAPVVEEGAVSRDVILPAGSWKDGNNGTIYQGPQIIKDYSAPIDVLPFFIKQ